MTQDPRANFWLRLAYWVGAVVDAVAAGLMLHPPAYAALTQLPDFGTSGAYRYAMAFGASLMAGWTLLLIWADRKPLERRGVLLITVFPVICGLNASRLILLHYGLIANAFPPGSLVLPAVLIGLFLFAYLRSFGPFGKPGVL